MYGWLSNISPFDGWLLLAVGALALGFMGAKLFIWAGFLAGMFWLMGLHPVIWVVVLAPMAVMLLPPLRRALVSNQIMTLMDRLKLMPVISETERVALEAGTTWVDAELFSGKPNFRKVLNEPYNKLNAEEQAFIDGPVTKVCEMIDDWEVSQSDDLPKAVWDYLKQEKFFGMIIPKEHGGLGYSALCHSEVIAKLAPRCVPLCVTVMVPNSLGPGELLAHYGTKEQKEHYLPRLARGEEIPCFGLTEPNAGSDAGAIASEAVVFKGDDGKLYLRLNWNKRYITLAAVSTLIGLAVKLRDPDGLLGKGEDVGITCVLVPADTDGVELGRRHNPMGIPFYNCPTRGKDVVVSVDQIIGGPEGAGRGWQMLMESLAAGRSISLPSQSVGGSKALTALTSAYSVIRRQFGISIGKFEGIEEPLARIAGSTYYMDALRIFTAGAVDSGMKPAVVSAIAKFSMTEQARRNINDAMDIMGGAGISRGPRNQIAQGYIGMPISITVEGANILTRTMIIFGQGAIRCHPYAYTEVKALMEKDGAAFDKAFWGHIGHVVRNTCRSVLLSLSRGRLAKVPSGPGAKYYRKLAWASASYAIMADIAMGTLGGALKMKEKLTGRYADAFCWMYIATCALRRYEAEGFRKDHREVFEYSMQIAMAKIQEAFDGIFENFEAPVIGVLFRGPLALWSRFNRFGGMPSDRLTHKISKAIQQPGALRDSLIEGTFISGDLAEQGARLERTFKLCHQADEIYAKIRKAVKAKQLPKRRPTQLIKEALEANVISAAEAELLKETNEAREDAIQVDEFDLKDFRPALLETDPDGKRRAYG